MEVFNFRPKWWDHFCECVIPNGSTAIPNRDYLLWLDFWVFYFAFIVIFFHLWKTNRPLFIYKRPVYIFAFGEYNSKQVNVSAIKYFLAQFKGLELRTENLNAATNYLFGIIFTKCKYIYRSFVLGPPRLQRTRQGDLQPFHSQW